MILTDEAVGKIICPHLDLEWDQNDMAREISVRSRTLKSQGLDENKIAFILHGGTPGFFADLFAVWSLGACAICLNPASTTEEITNILKFLEPAVILVDGTRDDLGGLAVTVMDLGESGGEYLSPAPPIRHHGRLDNKALILFTSGTTGTPKGVVHTFRGLLARIALNLQFMPKDQMGTALCALPTHFGHGLIGNCLTPMAAGADLVLVPSGDVRTISRLGEMIDRHQVEFMSSVPAMWKIAVKASKPPEKGSLKRVHIGSAPLSSELWQKVIAWSNISHVFNMYGITETANWAAGASASDYAPEDGLIGKPWGGSFAVLDDAERVSREGTGELLIKNPSIFAEFINLPEQTNAVFFNGWFRTGDIGTIDETGVARLTGRKKFEINRAGLKVNPEDIDILLERHPGINEACAFAVPDAIAGEIVGVAVVLDDGIEADAGHLKDWCANYITKEKIPERWFFVGEIPKTDRGKINRYDVADACLGPNSE